MDYLERITPRFYASFDLHLAFGIVVKDLFDQLQTPLNSYSTNKVVVEGRDEAIIFKLSLKREVNVTDCKFVS